MRIRFAVAFVVTVPSLAAAAEWKPAAGRLMTRWAKDVSPDNALSEYPRPQMVREQWLNLNGLWDYAIRTEDQMIPPKTWDGQILVPFPIESALSGVMKNVGQDSRLWYRRTFQRPADWKSPRTLLHFGAVDWDTTVWVNGKQVAAHRGGYDPFSCDVTDALKAGGDQELVVSVFDPTDASYQPRGKQVREPHGIWYTAVTGIWQTVWLEPVPETYIRGLTVMYGPGFDEFSIKVDIVNPQPDWKLGIVVSSQPKAGSVVRRAWHDAVNEPFKMKLGGPGIKLNLADHEWSPDRPHLIDVYAALVDDPNADLLGLGQEWMPRMTGPGAPERKPPVAMVDYVRSYAALRKIEVKQDDAGVNRLFLNGETLFQYGPLDQGWWPDGLYTAPTDEALKYDIEMTKKLGFNMCRKHVKVEPERWYYWCDKLGLLVWQDMPSGDRYIRERDPDIERSAESEANFRREWQAIIEANRNHPSIVGWVPFNEGWGQFKTNEILAWTKEFDPTRLVDGPSGWSDRGGGDMHDMHRYPGPGMYAVEDKRASVLGEFGGLGLPVEGHTWLDKGNWGYRSFTNREDLGRAYETIVGQLPFLIADGLAAAVYTQTTDVEIEVNGLMTYDRAVTKFDVDRMAAFHQRLYSSRPTTKTVVPTSEESPQTWRYTTTAPEEGWEQPDFDAAAWKEAPGGFGEPSTPGSVVRTQWKTNDIWLRRTISVDKPGDGYGDLYLRLHHDEEAEIYVNGVLAAKVTGYSTSYVFVPMDEAARRALKAGENTLAVHCKQTGGGQYVDVGVVEVRFEE